ncbi:hypothetical protein PybrP1_008691 [[Pythium] brassicae (nom. inval.)]|nr:hypothetical protein PybrP1_008691 [[Pythium] brassicae (nom. inval.)]
MRSRSRSPSLEVDPALAAAAAHLPAAQHREELLAALERHRVVVCVGETGSGKTTQLPKFLLATGARVAVTQPRRVAAVAAAQRVAQEVGAHVGGRVGYAVRFDERTSARTRVKFLTDGVLVRECLADPLLRRYDCVVLDEAHERSLHTDVLLGLLKQLLARRPRDFRVVVASATLDHERFAAFFRVPSDCAPHDGDDAGAAGARMAAPRDRKRSREAATTAAAATVPCPVVQIAGRAFPVDIFHSKTTQVMGRKGPLSSYVRAAVETALQVHNSEPAGHVLVFLTGQQEVDDACRQIRELHRQQRRDGVAPAHMALRVLPLYGALPSAAQRAIFEPVSAASVRKVVKVYSPTQHMEALVVVPVSKVSAQQRAGRAGRTAPGKCFRLYSKASYAQMADETVPEIRRANLANTVLSLKLLGVHDVLGFPYFDPPDADALLDALEQLLVLGALDARGATTTLGRLMAAFPLEPKLSRALVEAVALGCERDMAVIVAMLSAENVFEQPAAARHGRRRRGARTAASRDDDSDSYSDSDSDDGGENRRRDAWEAPMLKLKSEGMLSEHGDHLSYLAIYRGFERAHHKDEWCRERRLRLRALQTATSIQQQIQDIVDKLSPRDVEELKTLAAAPAVCAGYFMNAARRCTLQTVYRLLNREAEATEAKLVHLHPQSTLNYAAPPEYCVYQELVATSKPFMRSVVAVDSKWIDAYKRGNESVSIDALYALCGRAAPAGHQPTMAPGTPATVTAAAPASNKPRVDDGAVAAARARFLARKKARTDAF